MPVLRDPIGNVFGISPANRWTLTFPGLYNYCDQLFGEDFEGVKRRANFTEEQWYYIRASTRYGVETPLDDLGRQLFITKMLRKPLASMGARLQQVLQGEQSRDNLRFFIHSAHDFQIAQLLLFL
jgi:hypothetical protein